MPYYLVTSPTEKRLVEARNGVQAVHHVVNKTIKAEVLTSPELVNLMEGGMKVEKASPETKGE